MASEIMLCQFKAGKMTTKKISMNMNSPIAKVLNEASTFCEAPAERIVLSYQGRLLNKNDKLDNYEVSNGGLIMAAEVPPLPEESVAKQTSVKLSNEDVRKFTVSFKTALKSPSFAKVVKRLLEKENMDNLSAACPGLSDDTIAQAFLTKPDLLSHLCHPDTLHKVAEAHPCLLEAANNLAAAVHEEQQSAGKPGGSGTAENVDRTAGGSYYLDEMSDEEMDTDDGQQRPQRSRSFTGGITAAQLAQALASASGMGQMGGNFNPFQGMGGVTGMGVGNPPRASSQEPGQGSSQQTSEATTPNSASRITSNMFQQAMQQALLSSGMGQSPSGPAPAQQNPGQDGDLSSKVERMKEMGIIDEGLAIQALQIMGGDLQAAVDLIFSGWEGGDEAMS